MSLGELIYTYRKNHGMSMQEFANKSGLSKGYISMIEKGKHPQSNRSLVPSIETMDKLANAMHMSIDELLASVDGSQLISLKKERTVKNDSPDHFRIPVLGYVAAGIPIEEIEDIVDYEEIPTGWLRGGKKYFGLVLRGDSMEPRMYDGDVVIVEKQDDAETGAYVIAAVNGDHATCKRLMKYRDSIALLSLNSKYDPMIFTNEEVRSKPVTILGVVREIRGKMKGM